MTVKLIAFIFCITVISEITGPSLPSYLQPCNRNDPGINECLIKLMENIRPYISKGIPEMHILPLDPVMVPSVTLKQDSAGSVNFVALFTDLMGYGVKNFQINKMKISFKNQSLEIDVYLPLFRIESRYEINGKILVLPIKGNGKFVGNFTNVSAKIKFDLKIVKKKNHKNFFDIKQNKISLEIGTVKLHFSNLFNGNKQLGDHTNRFINDNWKDLKVEIKPLLEDTVSSIIIGIIKPVFETFSMDDIFPV
ncbi:PREDICTED: protein takeout-like [Diuraphis noxia]|uniref:protein takeout-like n=1 Tax=Diuraphis noxia TaxID=143948 RepID=UPI00076398FE|nr:PREDICTED: protein takeout-like [Diuraphis noxia]